MLGSGVQILTPLHPTNVVLRRQQSFGKPIEVGVTYGLVLVRSSWQVFT